MLGELDGIDWRRLRHAYGSAGDVPGQVRALASDDATARQEALGALFGNVWHQGTVYEATSYVVPFLIDLATSPQIHERAGILSLLGEIAGGSSYWAVHEALAICAARRGTPEHEAQKAHELEWVRLAHEAVGCGIDALLGLVEGDPDAPIRAAATAAIGRFPEHAGAVAPRLAARVGVERDPIARAATLFALGSLREPTTTSAIDAALGDSSRLVVLAAAVARAALPSPAEACIEALLAAIEDPEPIDDEMVELSYDHSDASATACAALVGVGSAAVATLPRLVQILRRCDPFRATEIGTTILELAFAADDATRRAAIAGLADADPFWAANSEKLVRASGLESRGLPADREALRAHVPDAAGLPFQTSRSRCPGHPGRPERDPGTEVGAVVEPQTRDQLLRRTIPFGEHPLQPPEAASTLGRDRLEPDRGVHALLRGTARPPRDRIDHRRERVGDQSAGAAPGARMQPIDEVGPEQGSVRGRGHRVGGRKVGGERRDREEPSLQHLEPPDPLGDPGGEGALHPPLDGVPLCWAAIRRNRDRLHRGALPKEQEEMGLRHGRVRRRLERVVIEEPCLPALPGPRGRVVPLPVVKERERPPILSLGLLPSTEPRKAAPEESVGLDLLPEGEQRHRVAEEGRPQEIPSRGIVFHDAEGEQRRAPGPVLRVPCEELRCQRVPLSSGPDRETHAQRVVEAVGSLVIPVLPCVAQQPREGLDVAALGQMQGADLVDGPPGHRGVRHPVAAIEQHLPHADGLVEASSRLEGSRRVVEDLVKARAEGGVAGTQGSLAEPLPEVEIGVRPRLEGIG